MCAGSPFGVTVCPAPPPRFGSAIANSEVRNDTMHVVIKLTLHSNGYD